MPNFFLKTTGLFLLAFLIFLAHRYFLFPTFGHVKVAFLNFSYLFNLGATLFIVLISFLIGYFTKRYLGFIVMVFGVLKIILFILLQQKLEFDLGRCQLLHFFVPYAIGLGIEIFFITGQLKTDNPNTVNDLD